MMDNCMYIGMVENGFVLEVKSPKKEEKSDKDSPMKCCGGDYEWKKYYFKTADELSTKVAELLPLIHKMHMAEAAEEEAEGAYEKAFKRAVATI